MAGRPSYVCTSIMMQKCNFYIELSGSQKVKRIVLVTLKITAALGLLYFFICSIDILGSAFQVLGGKKTIW